MTIRKTWMRRRNDLSSNLKILPTEYGNKHCSIKGHPDMQEDDLWRKAGAATGAQICLDGLVVVDIDKRIGEVTLDTYAVRSLSGLHLYFRLPDGMAIESKVSTTIDGVEIKAPGSCITVADSYVSGHTYTELTSWDKLRELTPEDIEYWGITEMNAVPQQKDNTPELRVVNREATQLEDEKGRNEFLFKKVVKPLCWSIICEEDIVEFADQFNKMKWNPPLPRHEIEAMVKGADRPYPSKKLTAKLISPESINTQTVKAALRRVGVRFRYDSVAGRPEIKRPEDKAWHVLDQNESGGLHLDLKEGFMVSYWKKHETKDEHGNKKFYYRMSDPYHLPLQKDDWKLIIEQQTKDNQVIPFREDYLNKLPEWDGKERLKGLLSKFFILDNDGAKLAQWIIPAVFRAAVLRNTREESYKFDMMPILIGAQGIGKSTIIKMATPSLRPEWYNDSIQFDIHHTKFMEQTMQAIFVEYAEMRGIKTTGLENIKATLSAEADMHRVPYKQYAEKFSRRCMLFGTSNDNQVLPSDYDGHRRFVVISIIGKENKTDLIREYMAENRDQLWAEAKILAAEDDHKWSELPQEMQDVRKILARRASEDADIEEAFDVWLKEEKFKEYTLKDDVYLVPCEQLTRQLGFDGDKKYMKDKVGKVMRGRGYRTGTKWLNGRGQNCIMIGAE